MRSLLVMWLLLAGHAALACQVTPLATVPVDVSTPNLVVEVSINGRPEPFILDTGTEQTILDVMTVDRLHLPRDQWVATTTHGIGGDDRERNALPGSLVLGSVALHPRTVAPGLSLPVARLPPGLAGGRPIAGLLGADLLAAFDLMLDGPRRSLTLYDVRGCAGRFLPWNRPYITIPTIRPTRDVLLVPVRIDGHVLLAQIDSGAAATVILAPGMAKLGLTENMLGGDPTGEASGVGPGHVVVHLHRFATMTIAGQTLENPALPVGAGRSLRIVDMLLGTDWLRPRLVWLSYATTQVFVAGP